MSDVIVPEFATDTVRISGLPELQAHMQELTNDPSAAFNPKLFDDVELQLTEDNIPPLLPVLLGPLTTILKSTTQDPTPCLSLTIKLLSPVPLTRTLTIADPPSLLTALASPLPGANLLALAILHKGAASPADAAILSTLPELIEALVRRWLETDDVGVAERAARVLGDLLETDCHVVPHTPGGATTPNGVRENSTQLAHRRRRHQQGHNRLWPLFLESRSIASLIPQLCTPSVDRTPRQTSLSQGRLLRLLPRLATLNIAALTSTTLPDLFSAAPTGAQAGLLPWAALSMVDAEDVLMHLNLVDFFETLVSVMRVAETRTSGTDATLRWLIRTAASGDEQLTAALRSLPDRTVEEEAEPLREYIDTLLR
ncbi:hypothetical protein ACRE_084980 [Hapsidospora chrysogenum ATCC 11550]|uniref:DNA mismatch repair protein HSM3 N-terminal domain-containing protein n=1 Tax=Hapsidospora chrysogenum (strain ATCC 11550 / CBS 779.69 / DSM 880 / IAM 14645 / JCM 23072 / IMI 49137) TaxID=857340 RepID=A0A086SUL4_HAPC1|nr:hypothetical protein ACRE_084980 [Hapsidospora chrysogenum ATCC 11550]